MSYIRMNNPDERNGSGNFQYTNPYTSTSITQQQQHPQQQNTNSRNSAVTQNSVTKKGDFGYSNNFTPNNRMDDDVSMIQQNHDNKTKLNVELIIQQLERWGPKASGEAIPSLKSLLQISCTETWNVSQVCRFSEWLIASLECNLSRTKSIVKVMIPGDSNSDIYVVCTYATLTLHQLMETHWDDLFIYTSIMSRNDDEAHSSSQTDNRSLLDVLFDTACLLGKDNESSSACHSLLVASVSALSTSWQALDRLYKLTSATSDHNNATLISSQNISDSSWWISQHRSFSAANVDVTDDSIDCLIQIVVKGLLIEQDDWQRKQQQAASLKTGLQLCEYKTSCVNVIIQILDSCGDDDLYRQKVGDEHDIVPKKDWYDLLRQLLQEALRLNDANMPVSAFAIWSLSSFHLLSTINSISTTPYWVSTVDDMECEEFSLNDEYRRIIQSSDVVDHIIRATFWTPGINLADDSPRPKPRWTQQSDTKIVQKSFNLLQALYRISPVLIGNHVSHHPMVKHFLATQWTILTSRPKTLSNTSHTNLDKLNYLLFLHNNCRSLTRDVLKQTIESQQILQNKQFQKSGTEKVEVKELYQNFLFHLIERRNHPLLSVSAMVLLKILLEDGFTLLRNDELARNLWECIDGRFLEKIIEGLFSAISSVSHHKQSSVSEYHRPLLLCTIDVANVLLHKFNCEEDETSSDQANFNRSIILELLLKNKSHESLMELTVGTTYNSGSDLSKLSRSTMDDIMESDADTPPVNNLSRIENPDTCVNTGDTAELRQIAVGFDPIIRLAGAQLLAIIGTDKRNGGSRGKQDEKRNSVIQSKMIEAANSVVSSFNLTFSSVGSLGFPSIDTTKRRLKLLSALVSRENEEHLSCLIHDSEIYQISCSNNNLRTIQKLRQELQASQIREQHLISENDVLKRRLEAQSRRFQNEKCEWQRSIAQNAKQLVDVHVSERSKAEKRAQDLSKGMAEAERLLADADVTVKSCKESEAKLRTTLGQMSEKFETISLREKDILQQKEKAVADVRRLKDEMASAQSVIKNLQDAEKHMREQIDQQTDTLAYVEQSESELKVSLENLFADMCCLAHLYEVKEREASSYQESGEMVVEKLKRKLEMERQKYVELDERQKRIQYENEMLSKKYAKARDKLEEEREDRRRENERRKRAAPVSYINQLHLNQSTICGESQGVRSNRNVPPLGHSSSHRSSNANSSSHSSISSSSHNNTCTSRDKENDGATSFRSHSHSSKSITNETTNTSRMKSSSATSSKYYSRYS